MVVAADDVSDAHVVIVDHHAQHVGRVPSERSRMKSSSSLFCTATRPWTWSSITVSPSRGP
jgi:hypothetical protein